MKQRSEAAIEKFKAELKGVKSNLTPENIKKNFATVNNGTKP